ncbi:ABC1 kinase family protein [Nocardia coubleae]|uniref:AarF/ABC1/UbiB kinase family protein n=1 Tax=Nocardia coubleae TaxID=356147 RepID=A0A846WB04_9NOCA|nr:AarF/ABC1/UbiB kinase family protein [Nocardia coubleae]NKX89993.1 AarF/ABC1/UbiB kinase family protein [Nocardia coubleae]
MPAGIPGGRVARGAKLGQFAAGQAVRGVGRRLSMIGRTEEARQVLAERSAMTTAQQIVTVLGSMKGSAMKLGQMASVLDLDFVPESHREHFRAQLAALQDKAPAVAFPTMRAVIEEDLGPLGGVFADFDETAIAAASIGQVHRATLRDGRVVAVKVKYPGVERAVHADIGNLEFLSKMGRSVLPSMADTGVLEEIADNLRSELDYEREARTQHRVARRYRGHPFITVPDAIVEHCSHNVLVTEYVESQPFSHMRTLPDADRDHLGELIYRFYISSLFVDNEFCGDPHPGNMLLAADGKLAFVDFGLYKQMDPAHVDFERDVLRAAAEGRGEDLYTAWVDRGIIDPSAGVSVEESLAYVWAATGWHLLDEDVTITPELATGALLLAVDPRSSQFHGMHRQLLPPEHVFSRRADLFTFATLGQLRATANWHLLAREWLYREPPVTEVGREIDRWRRSG